MEPRLAPWALVFATAALSTYALTWPAKRFAERLGAVVRPDERRVHEKPTPTLGGLAMLGGLLTAMGVSSALDYFSPMFTSTTEPIGVVLSAALIFLVGAIDDLKEVSAPARLAGMALAASLLILSGVSMLNFRIPFGGVLILSPDLSYFVSVLWVVGMANALNFVDGLDGLAGGIAAIASTAFFLYALRLAQAGIILEGNIGPLLACIVAGVCVGFLPHNIHPARIFMGDGGAYLLGLLLAAATMVVGGRTDQEFSGQTYFFFAPLVIPLFILGVPILDTLFAILRRATRGRGLATADKDHLHHRLMRLGHGQRRAVVILWGWTALLSGFVLYPTYTGEGDAIVPFGVAAMALALYTLFHPGLRRDREPHALDRSAGSDSVEQPGSSDLRRGAPTT